MTTTEAATPLLQEFGPCIWVVDGPTVSFFGFPYPTRMVVIQLEEDKSTWIWSPIELTQELSEALEQLGLNRVQHVVSPNKIHHIFLKQWQDAFPEATFYAPPGLSKRNVVTDVRFDKQLDSSDDTTEPPAFHQEIDQVIFHGSFFMEEVVFFHRKSETAIFCDLIQRFPEEEMTGFKGTLMRLDGLVGKEGSTPREWRFSFLFGGKGKARAARTTVVEEWKPKKLIIAHGECVSDGSATDVVSKALGWM